MDEDPAAGPSGDTDQQAEWWNDGRRTVVVTGASRGIGLGIARVLAAEGYRVVAVARRGSEPLAQAVRAAASVGAGALDFMPLDLDDIAAIPAFFGALRKGYGPLYGLVNNAGMGMEGLLATMATADIERRVRLNTLAPVVMTKHAGRSMMSAGDGRIVNMSSITATHGYSGLSVYAASKASMVGFTRSLAREVGPLGITVNAVAPGLVETDMTSNLDKAQRDTVARRSALKRLPDVDDVAHAVAYLLSAKARNVTGTVLTVDAGSTA